MRRPHILPSLGQRLLAKLEDNLPVLVDRRCQRRPDMVYTSLGRTGLQVSVMGLGCGGYSRLGLGVGKTPRQAAGLVRSALALGINLIDTAEAYGTEPVVGRALREVPRDSVILSTKKVVDHRRRILTPQDLIASLDRSLQRLGTDYVDIYHLHGVKPDCYAAATEALVPTLEALRQAGKIRFLGITESFSQDLSHQTLQQAVPAGPWDVIMTGFNLLNPSARHTVFPYTQARGIGVLGMFAVRRALASWAALTEAVQGMIAAGYLDGDRVTPAQVCQVLATAGRASPAAAAYRLCRHEPGVDCVLFGTGNPAHLLANVEALLSPPLPEEVLAQLEAWFGAIDQVSGE